MWIRWIRIRIRIRNTASYIEEGRAASKSKNLAILFLCPSKQFLPISFQIQLLEYFPHKQKEQRHRQLGYSDKLVTTQI
jgi:hypothetical protein